LNEISDIDTSVRTRLPTEMLPLNLPPSTLVNVKLIVEPTGRLKLPRGMNVSEYHVVVTPLEAVTDHCALSPGLTPEIDEPAALTAEMPYAINKTETRTNTDTNPLFAFFFM
jgi:hypothetical protein